MCALDCACGGFTPEWINVPSGMNQQLDVSRRRRTLFTDSATIGMSGVYTCQLVRNNVVEVIRTYTITVTP